jgi:hypothetical protein
MVKTAKNFKVFVLILLTSILFLAAISPNIGIVKAQTNATVVVFLSAGGVTTPPPGTTTYANGTVVSLNATAGDGFFFQNWEIITSAGGVVIYANPTTLTVSGGVSYAVQAIFQPVQSLPTVTENATVIPVNPDLSTSPNLSNDAIVIVLAGVGGNTIPAPGTYALANAANFNLTAVPENGWVFSNWVIGGYPLSHGGYSFTDTPTNNPYNVDHGYGYTYSYEAVFRPVSTTATPTPTINEFSSATAIILAAVLVLVAFGTYIFTKKPKK